MRIHFQGRNRWYQGLPVRLPLPADPITLHSTVSTKELMATSALTTTTTTAAGPASVLHESTVELSIRLMHAGVKIDDALKSSHGLVPYDCRYGKLLFGTTEANPPDWAAFLESSAPGITGELSGQHSSAVLLIEAGPAKAKRLFAICFGQGHHAIETDFMERQFGLRVVLNSVARDKLRSLDSAGLDTTVIQRRTLASRESDLLDFGLDTDRELLRQAAGSPGDAHLAKAMSGKDALHVRRKMAISGLPSFCAELLELYAAKDYQKDYKFIDQVKPVHKGKIHYELDALLFAELMNVVGGHPSDLHLAVPDFLAPDQVPALRYLGPHLPHKKETFSELAIDDYVAQLKKGKLANVKRIEDIRAHEVCAVSTDLKKPFDRMKVYDCFVFETLHDNVKYVLFDAQWHQISDDYFKEVEEFYLGQLRPSFLTASSAKNERALIAELNDPRYADLLCMDQTKSSPAGATGANLEVCDFFSKARQMIHLKDSEDSAPLSHLWSQGLVSAQSLMSDRQFRKQVRKAAGEREKLHGRMGFVHLLPTEKKIDPAELTIVYGILKKKHTRSKKLNIPFFSKVALRATVRQLTMMGYHTELHLIEKR